MTNTTIETAAAAIVDLDREAAAKDLRDLAAKIDAEHSAAHGHARRALERAAECGRHLIAAKALVEHGDWLPWLEGNTSVGARQSQKYMRLAEGWAEIEAKCDPSSHLTFNRALELIAAPQETAPEPDPQAIEIGMYWRRMLVSLGDFASVARELRVRLQDDDKLIAVHMLHSGAGKEFASKVPKLCEDQADDEAWVDAFLDDGIALVDSYSPPPGKKLLHGTEKEFNALRSELGALRVEVETAGRERVLEIIERCHKIQVRRYQIRRSILDVSAGLSHIANRLAQA